MKSFTRFAFCPRCSSDRIEIHDKNAVKCSACGYTYYHNCASAVAAIVEIDRRILLIKRAHDPQKGFYDLPGGFVDYKESLETAVVREVKEECGLDVTDLRYFGSFPNTYVYCDVTYFSADAFFICTAVDARMLRVSGEASEFMVVEPKAVDMHAIAFGSVKNVLTRYREQYI
jgi:ADP-ribose pyrophosphatase YjhB (NUDIX family)